MASCLYVGPRLDSFRHRQPRGSGGDDGASPSRDPAGGHDPGPRVRSTNWRACRTWPASSWRCTRAGPGRTTCGLPRSAAKMGRRVWFYWPAEDAIECIDGEQLTTYWNLWVLHAGGPHVAPRGARGGPCLAGGHVAVPDGPGPRRPGQRAGAGRARRAGAHGRGGRAFPPRAGGADACRRARADGRGPLATRRGAPRSPVPASTCARTSGRRSPPAAATATLATWRRNWPPSQNGSPASWAAASACSTSYGLHQVVLPRPSETSSESDLLEAHWAYYPQLKLACRALRPAYIYERLCMGNFCGAALSHELGIPYIVEYNGSEISMTRSFGGVALTHEDVFIAAEDAAFRQATMISVVSQVMQGLARGARRRRGEDPGEPERRRPRHLPPMAPAAKAALRAELGFAPDDRVVGFTGTFGGWHGIDVLAKAIPTICAASAARHVPAHRRRHAQALRGRRRGRARARATGEERGPRAASRRRAVARRLRPLRVTAQQPHGGQQVLRLADQAVRVHGDGRRHRRQRPRATWRGVVAGAAGVRFPQGRRRRGPGARRPLHAGRRGRVCRGRRRAGRAPEGRGDDWAQCAPGRDR